MEKVHNFYQIFSKGFMALKKVKNNFLIICAPEITILVLIVSCKVNGYIHFLNLSRQM